MFNKVKHYHDGKNWSEAALQAAIFTASFILCALSISKLFLLSISPVLLIPAGSVFIFAAFSIDNRMVLPNRIKAKFIVGVLVTFIAIAVVVK